MSNDNKIFDLLKIIDDNDIHALASISKDEKKKLAPVVVMRWLSGCKNKDQLLALNSFTNPIVFKLYKHQDLLFKTMMVCSTGPKRYNWIGKKTKSYKFPKILEVLSKKFSCNLRESQDMLGRISAEEIYTMAEEYGFDVEFLAALRKEIKQYENI
jgi:hypothetical protein